MHACAYLNSDIADAIAKKESGQVNEKFSELKNGDIGMVTKVWRQDFTKFVQTAVELRQALK